MIKAESLSPDELDMLLNALTTCMAGLGGGWPTPYPNKRYWSKKRQEKCHGLYQKMGKAIIATKNVQVTWEDLCNLT